MHQGKDYPRDMLYYAQKLGGHQDQGTGGSAELPHMAAQETLEQITLNTDWQGELETPAEQPPSIQTLILKILNSQLWLKYLGLCMFAQPQ